MPLVLLTGQLHRRLLLRDGVGMLWSKELNSTGSLSLLNQFSERVTWRSCSFLCLDSSLLVLTVCIRVNSIPILLPRLLLFLFGICASLKILDDKLACVLHDKYIIVSHLLPIVISLELGLPDDFLGVPWTLRCSLSDLNVRVLDKMSFQMLFVLFNHLVNLLSPSLLLVSDLFFTSHIGQLFLLRDLC